MLKKIIIKLAFSLLMFLSPIFATNLIFAPHTQWITIHELSLSLPQKQKLNVGFDIDDTLLFTSATFYQGVNTYCPEGRDGCHNNRKFWNWVNSHTNYDYPKQTGIQLIKLHQLRGDNIYFITARHKSKGSAESLSARLKKVFHLKHMNPVIFVGDNDSLPGAATNIKTKEIRKHKITVFYGDADSDITSALNAKIRAIRVIRAVNSVDTNLPMNGKFGEEVIVNSDS